MAAAATTRSADGTSAEDVFAGTPYRVVRRLGAGEMSEVFLVLHEQLDRKFVAKLLHERFARDEQLLERVRIEAQSLARLRNRNLVEVTDFRRTRDGRPFLVMEQLVGRTLQAELAARHALPVSKALDLVHQALSALVAAHSLGIVHRDIRPENLFLCEDLDKSTILKVLDFGIARVIPGTSTEAPLPLSLETETGIVLGTPRYLSPEAALGRRVDQRADLYALALVFYEMVAGRGPFDHVAIDILTAHAVQAPAAPSALASEPVPAEVDAAILRGLLKNPDERYQSATEFQREVERLRALTRNSQALETTAFSLEEIRNRPRGPRIHQRAFAPAPKGGSTQLPEARESDPAAVPNLRPGLKPAVSAASGKASLPAVAQLAAPRGQGDARPALILVSILVAFVTAVAVTILISLALARVAP